jgi:tetratricopeptide (TPR) repeat protein
MRILICSAALLAGCASSAPPPKLVAPPTRESLPTQIIAPHAEGNSRELFARAEAALSARKLTEAIDNFTALLSANEPSAADLFPTAMFDLGVAYEGNAARQEARDDYARLLATYPENALAKQALLRILDLDAFLEDWDGLGKTAQIMLDRGDTDDIDRMSALGARGLSEIEMGSDVQAGRDVEAGLEISERLNIGAGGRLPASVSQLRFALGEIRRVRSERIHFVPEDVPDAMSVPADFLAKMNARCEGLMDAQHAYGEAMRSVDAHWIAMSGFRVGEMYRKLHHDLMVIPPTLLAKSDKQKQIFFAIMHVRYRVLLEKGADMMDRTISVADAGLDSSDWITRARALKADIELALDEEKTVIKSFPFTEDEIKKAIEILRQKAEKQQDQQNKKK